MLTGELSKTVSLELLNVASRIWECAESYPDAELPQKLENELIAILDALETMQKAVCDKDSQREIPRHPKCCLTRLQKQKTDGPLRMSLEEAEEICTALYEEEERVNRLIDKVRGSLSASDMKKFVNLSARIMGNIFAGILRPLWYQHPSLNRGVKEE